MTLVFLAEWLQLVSGFSVSSTSHRTATDVSKRTDCCAYMQWELKPHNLLSATAYGNRLIIMVRGCAAVVLSCLQDSFPEWRPRCTSCGCTLTDVWVVQTLKANAIQWRRAQSTLRTIQDSLMLTDLKPYTK